MEEERQRIHCCAVFLVWMRRPVQADVAPWSEVIGPNQDFKLLARCDVGFHEG